MLLLAAAMVLAYHLTGCSGDSQKVLSAWPGGPDQVRDQAQVDEVLAPRRRHPAADCVAGCAGIEQVVYALLQFNCFLLRQDGRGIGRDAAELGAAGRSVAGVYHVICQGKPALSRMQVRTTRLREHLG